MATRFVLPLADVGGGIVPQNGAKLDFFVTGSTTVRKDTFSDEAASTANVNPVISNSLGRFPDIFLPQGGVYKVILKDENDVQIWSEDPVTGSISSTNVARIFDTVADMVADLELDIGHTAQTLGYLSKTGGGGNTYEIVAAATGTANFGDFIDLATHQAKALYQGIGEKNIKQFGANDDGATNTHANIQAAFASLGVGESLFIPQVVGASATLFYVINDTLKLTVQNQNFFRGTARQSGKISQTGVGKNGIDTDTTFFTQSTNGLEIKDFWLSTANPAVGDKGINLSGALKANITNVYLEGWKAGIFILDSFTNVFDKVFFAGGTDGIFSTSGGNNTRVINCEFESQAGFGINLGTGAPTPAQFVVDKCSFQACMKGAIQFVAGANVSVNYGYFEGNLDGSAGTFDIKYGIGPLMRGGHITNNHFLSNTSVNHYPIRIGNWNAGRVEGNNVGVGNQYIDFLDPGNGQRCESCFFGPVQIDAGTRVNNNLTNGTATYQNIDPLFVHRNNIMGDHDTIPCGCQNIINDEFPFGNWVTGGTGTAVFSRSPDTGAVPDQHNGRPVLLIDQSVGTNAFIQQGFTLSADLNEMVRGNWCTFIVDVLVDNAADKDFTLTLIGTGSTGTTQTFSAKDSDGFQRYAVNTFIDAAGTSLLAKIDCIEVAAYKFSNARLYVGLDSREMPGNTDLPVWLNDAIPTVGTWLRGDRIYLETAVSGAKEGFTCTVSGTPGTWVSMANLQ